MAKLTNLDEIKPPLSSEQLTHAIEAVRELCISSGVRFTEKRQKLLEVLLASPSPLSAYELVEHYYQRHNEELQIMSAYRILEFLVDEHLVHKLNLNNKFVACSRIRGCDQHNVSQFLICKECDKVEEVFIPAKLWNSLSLCGADVGFSLDDAHLEIACVCHACQKNQAG